MDDNVNIKITADVSGLPSGLSQAEQAVNKSVNAMKNAFASLNATVSGIGASFTQLGSKITFVSNTTNNFNSSAGASTSAINALNASITALSGHMSTLGGQINSNTTALNGFRGGAGGAGSAGSSLIGIVTGLGAAFGGLVSIRAATEYLKESKTAIIDAEKAYRSLEMTSSATGVGIEEANKLALKWSKISALTMTEAQSIIASALKVGAKDLKEVDQAMKYSADLMASGGQKGKKFGQGMVEGFEGWRQGIATNTDNMGWQENPAKAYENYAGSIGKATDALDKHEKFLAGLVSMQKEAQYVTGASAQMTDSLAGSESKLSKEYTQTKEIIGQAFSPAFKALNDLLGYFANMIGGAVKGVQDLAVFMAYGIQVMSAFKDGVKNFSLQKMNDELALAKKNLADYLQMQHGQDGVSFNDGLRPKKVDDKKEKDMKKKYEDAENAYKLALKTAQGELDLDKIKNENMIANYKAQVDAKIITHKEYAKKWEEIENSMATSTDKFLQAQLKGLQDLLKMKYEPKEAGVKVQIQETENKIKENEEKKNGIHAKATSLSFQGSSISSASDIAKANQSLEKTRLEDQLTLFRAHNKGLQAINDYKFANFMMSAKQYYAEEQKMMEDDYNKQIEIIKKEIAETEKLKPKNKAEEIKKKEDLLKLNDKLKLSSVEQGQRLDELTRKQEAYNRALEKQKALNTLDVNNARANINTENKHLQVNEDFALRKINERQMLEQQKLIEKEKYDNQIRYIEAKKAYLLQNETENHQAIAELDKELAIAKMQQDQVVAQFEQQLFLKQKQDYIDMIDTMKGALGKLFMDIAKHPKKFKEAMLDALTTISDKLLQIAANKLMEKAFGMNGAGGGGGILDSIVNAIVGGGSGSVVDTTAMGGNISNVSGGGGMLGSLMSMIPGLAVGTNFVPQDMLAVIHKGEAVVPARYNNDQTFGGKSRGVNVVNHFNLMGPADKQTKTQIAQKAGRGIKDALQRG